MKAYLQHGSTHALPMSTMEVAVRETPLPRKGRRIPTVYKVKYFNVWHRVYQTPQKMLYISSGMTAIPVRIET